MINKEKRRVIFHISIPIGVMPNMGKLKKYRVVFYGFVLVQRPYTKNRKQADAAQSISSI